MGSEDSLVPELQSNNNNLHPYSLEGHVTSNVTQEERFILFVLHIIYVLLSLVTTLGVLWVLFRPKKRQRNNQEVKNLTHFLIRRLFLIDLWQVLNWLIGTFLAGFYMSVWDVSGEAAYRVDQLCKVTGFSTCMADMFMYTINASIGWSMHAWIVKSTPPSYIMTSVNMAFGVAAIGSIVVPLMAYFEGVLGFQDYSHCFLKSSKGWNRGGLFRFSVTYTLDKLCLLPLSILIVFWYYSKTIVHLKAMSRLQGGNTTLTYHRPAVSSASSQLQRRLKLIASAYILVWILNTIPRLLPDIYFETEVGLRFAFLLPFWDAVAYSYGSKSFCPWLKRRRHGLGAGQDMRLTSVRSLTVSNEADKAKLKIFCTTWNMGDSQKVKDLSHWIPASGIYDLYVIAVQEAKALDLLRHDIHKYLGGPTAYVMFHSEIGDAIVLHGKIALTVFVKATQHASGAIRLQPAGGRASLNAGMNLGVGRAPNKGMCGLVFKVYDTSIAFVAAHFSADKHKKIRVENRNKDAFNLLRNLKLTGDIELFDPYLQYHHFVVLGDLNYRIRLHPDKILTTIANASRATQKDFPDEAAPSWRAKSYARLLYPSGFEKSGDTSGAGDDDHDEDPPTDNGDEDGEEDDGDDKTRRTGGGLASPLSLSTLSPTTLPEGESPSPQRKARPILELTDEVGNADEPDGLLGHVRIDVIPSPANKHRITVNEEGLLRNDSIEEGDEELGDKSEGDEEEVEGDDLVEDLNREPLKEEVGRSMSSSSVFSRIRSLTSFRSSKVPFFTEGWEELWAADELGQGKAKGAVFYQFYEPKITFPPSFKLRPGADPGDFTDKRSLRVSYKTQVDKQGLDLRPPSWTDRVLTYSLPDRKAMLNPSMYDMCDAVRGSDHRPVSQVMELLVERDIILSPPSSPVDGNPQLPLENVPIYNPKRLTAYMISVELTNFEFIVSEDATTFAFGHPYDEPPSPSNIPRPLLSWTRGLFSRSSAGSSGAGGSYISGANLSSLGGGNSVLLEAQHQAGGEISDWIDIRQVAEVNVLFPLPSEDPLVSDRRIIQIDRQVELPSESPQVDQDQVDNLFRFRWKDMSMTHQADSLFGTNGTNAAVAPVVHENASSIPTECEASDSSVSGVSQIITFGGQHLPTGYHCGRDDTSSPPTTPVVKFEAVAFPAFGLHAVLRFADNTGAELGQGVLCLTEAEHGPTLTSEPSRDESEHREVEGRRSPTRKRAPVPRIMKRKSIDITIGGKLRGKLLMDVKVRKRRQKRVGQHLSMGKEATTSYISTITEEAPLQKRLPGESKVSDRS